MPRTCVKLLNKEKPYEFSEWILVVFLSVALLIFLILAIILTIKLIDITKEVQKLLSPARELPKKLMMS